MRLAFRFATAAVAIVGLAAVVTSSRVVVAQSDGTRSGSVSGRIVAGSTTVPVPGTSVTLVTELPGTGRTASQSITTDADGRFAFPSVAEGLFCLTAFRSGWQTATYGLDTPQIEHPLDNLGAFFVLSGGCLVNSGGGGIFTPVRAGERVNAILSLWRNPVLSGRVTTETGEPLVRARVSALQWAVLNGRRTLAGNLTTTDDLGTFSITVPPGDYILVASSDEWRERSVTTTSRGQRFVLLPTYYPAAATSDTATPVSVKAGDERTGLDIRLPLTPARRITGSLRRVGDAPLPRAVSLRAFGESEKQMLWATRREWTASLTADGQFTFDSIPAGRYILDASDPDPFATRGPGVSAPGWVSASVDVGESDVVATADLHPPLRIRGRVVLDSVDAASTDASQYATLSLLWPCLGDVCGNRSVVVDASGQFGFDVSPGRYTLSPGLVANPDPARTGVLRKAWALRSTTSGGRDVADGVLDISSDVSDLVLTYTDRTAEVRGRVVGADVMRTTVFVVLFPTDDALWRDYPGNRRHRTMRPAVDGTFSFSRVPAGNYFVAAVQGAREPDLRYGALFEALAPTSMRITVHEGDVTTQELRMRTAPPVPSPSSAPAAPDIIPADSAAVVTVANEPSRGAAISGRVMDAQGNAPLPGVRVSISESFQSSAYTDDEGNFLLEQVPAGRHTLYARRSGYVQALTDQAGAPIVSTTNQRVNGVSMTMVRAAVITGTVVDENGGPLGGVEFRLFQDQWQPDGRRLFPVRLPDSGKAATTDEGRFRIWGVPPGDYVLMAGARSLSVSVPPASDIARGDRLRLTRGEERTVNLEMPAARSGRVTGIVRDRTGQTMPGTRLTLRRNDPTSALNPTIYSATTDGTGAFTVSGVAAGSYRLRTEWSGPQPGRRPATAFDRPPNRILSASMDVDLQGDVEGLVVEMRPAAALAGRIRAASPDLLTAKPNVRLWLMRMDVPAGAPDGTLLDEWDTSGRFMFENLQPGTYRLVVHGPAGAAAPHIVTQRVHGKETVHSGIEVKAGEVITDIDVLVQGGAQLGGVCLDQKGSPARGAVVVLFSRQSAAWAPPSTRIFMVQADQEGRFAFENVPAGDYLIAPVTQVEPNQWFDPDFLALLAARPSTIAVSTSASGPLSLRLP